jgi:predicted nucleotidyltransferase
VGAEPVAAEKILTEAANAYRAALGERLLAAYALGSLAHGGFSPLVSDIDVGLIVSDPTGARDAETIRAVADEQKANVPELCQRLSVFWGTPSTLRGKREDGRFPPLDRLDLIENGRLLLGTDARGGLTRPTAGELIVTGAEFALEFWPACKRPRQGRMALWVRCNQRARVPFRRSVTPNCSWRAGYAA